MGVWHGRWVGLSHNNLSGTLLPYLWEDLTGLEYVDERWFCWIMPVESQA